MELDRTLGWYNIQHSDIITLVKLPIQVSVDQAKTAYHNCLRQEEDWYGTDFEVDAPPEIAISDLEESHYKNLRIVGNFFEGGEVRFEKAKLAYRAIAYEIEEHWLERCSTRPHEIGIDNVQECSYKDYRIIGRFCEERIG